MRDRILAVLRNAQVAHPDLELLADEIVAAARGDGEDMLSASWDGAEEDIVYRWPVRGRKDMLLISRMFFGLGNDEDIIEELHMRGYDITTLRFEIRRKEA